MNRLCFILFSLLTCFIRLDTTPVSILPSLWMKLHEQATWDLSLWPLSYSSPVEAEWQLRGKELKLLSSPSPLCSLGHPCLQRACALLSSRPCVKASTGDPTPCGAVCGQAGGVPTARLWISALASPGWCSTQPHSGLQHSLRNRAGIIHLLCLSLI